MGEACVLRDRYPVSTGIDEAPLWGFFIGGRRM